MKHVRRVKARARATTGLTGVHARGYDDFEANPDFASFPLDRNRMADPPVNTALDRFSALALPQKVEALGAAAIRFEQHLEKVGRRIGHPADQPWDYLEGIGITLFGAGPSNLKPPAGLFSSPINTVDLLRGAGILVPDPEKSVLKTIGGLAVASDQDGEFLALIGSDGFWMPRPRTWVAPGFVFDTSLFAKMLAVHGCYQKVFVGMCDFVEASNPELAGCDTTFANITLSKQQFSYEGRDFIVYAAGAEFTSPTSKRRSRSWLPFPRA